MNKSVRYILLSRQLLLINRCRICKKIKYHKSDFIALQKIKLISCSSAFNQEKHKVAICRIITKCNEKTINFV